MLFPGRTIGYFIGTLLAKIVIKKYTNHTLMVYSVIGFSATSICFNFCSNISWQVFYICANAVALAFYDIITNTILLIFNNDKDKAFWVQTGHGMFGVGSLTSPIIAYFCELNTFMFFAMMNIIMVFGYYNLESP
jgi:MFS family permease